MTVAWGSKCEFGGWVAVVKELLFLGLWNYSIESREFESDIEQGEYVKLKGIVGGVLKTFWKLGRPRNYERNISKRLKVEERLWL